MKKIPEDSKILLALDNRYWKCKTCKEYYHRDNTYNQIVGDYLKFFNTTITNMQLQDCYFCHHQKCPYLYRSHIRRIPLTKLYPPKANPYERNDWEHVVARRGSEDKYIISSG